MRKQKDKGIKGDSHVEAAPQLQQKGMQNTTLRGGGSAAAMQSLLYLCFPPSDKVGVVLKRMCDLMVFC